MIIGIDVRPVQNERAGIGMYVSGLVTHLPTDSHRFVAFSSRAVSLPPHFQSRVIKLPSFLWHLSVWFDVLRKGISLYHSTHSLILPILLGKRCVFTLHDLTAVFFPHYHSLKVRFLYRFLLRLAVWRAGALIVTSESTKEDVKKLFPASSDKIFVVPCAVSDSYTTPVDSAAVSSVRDRYELAFPYILFVSTLEPRKNLERLMDAYFSLCSRFPELHLVVAGKKGWLYEPLFLKVRNNPFGNRIHFLGYVAEQELRALYADCAVFVFPSLYEGFGLTPLEAMSVGAPVAVSNVSSMPEVVGDCGLFFNPLESKEIADSISRIYSDAALRTTLIEKGKSRAQLFGWNTVIERTVLVYESFSKKNT